MSLRRKSIFAAYLFLLVASWIIMSLRREPLPSGGNWREIPIAITDGETSPMRYRLFPGSDPTKAPVLLLHGSPMASSCFDPLLSKLPSDRTYIVPDLPGFGKSKYGFSDLSFTAHAAAIVTLLEKESPGPTHIVAYSQGGGPALELSKSCPEKFASLTMLSSIGVQEHELTGDYFLNHSIHGLQLGALGILRWGVPHFGLFDRIILNTRYAKNFYQGDMRPLRQRFLDFQKPALIIHAESDGLVPPSAAREHHRILPQSEEHWLEGGHMVVFSKPDKVAGLLTAFFTKVDLGKAKTRMDANPARIAEAAAPALPRHLSFVALAITLTAIALATFASEDLTCLTAGLLAARGVIPLFDAMVACFVGIWIGDMLLYFIGRYGGRWAVARRPLRWLITPAAVDSAAGFLHKRGGTAVFSSRFMPGTRLPLYVAAGIVRVPLAKMAIWFGISGMLWAIPVVALVSLFGEKVTDWIIGMGKFVFPALILLLVIFHFAIRIVTVLATHQGRRILLAKWQHLIRWEFWPPYVLYIPVVLTLIPRILRRGNPLALTACNPGIAHSGIMGESKSAILTALDPSGNVPPFLLIPADVPEKSRIAQQWISSKGITFPLVIKPDSGERGNGVSIVKSHPELDAELAQREEPQILQAYVPGDEFGILYICPPDGETPYISSVTRKVMTQVTGDGIRTLEELILNDSRAYLSHRHFFQTHSAILGEIPANGEKITLATLGSHCRGSLFLDGSDLITPELTAEVQRISETFPGFRIGRYDIRCPSEAELMAGKNLRIIELNGMTSEPTHIYHPHTPLRTGLRALISHWDTAHRIGLENLRNSARASSFQELFLLLKNRR